jgi:hypothetical protein
LTYATNILKEVNICSVSQLTDWIRRLPITMMTYSKKNFAKMTKTSSQNGIDGTIADDYRTIADDYRTIVMTIERSLMTIKR